MATAGFFQRRARDFTERALPATLLDRLRACL
ncbi:hypothetical protein EDC22_1038 [Tepidamorphus gemmatus]|uniref:Uncharacterized protein n=1 Tax=Tepidamorphus gemmatus TaxID=747076 RepID=A0A4R3MH51_9HYPH|nr:hypothetical protein EDC22_1038 [Tepidamorphus gemmatus]